MPWRREPMNCSGIKDRRTAVAAAVSHHRQMKLLTTAWRLLSAVLPPDGRDPETGAERVAGPANPATPVVVEYSDGDTRSAQEEVSPAPKPSLPASSSGSGRNGQGSGDDLAHRLCHVDICEVLSPPRVGVEATKFCLVAGDAMDLITGWGFSRRDHQLQAEKRLDQQKPRVLIGGPPCTCDSTRSR